LNIGIETFSFSDTTLLTVFHVSEMLDRLFEPSEKVEDGGGAKENATSTAVSDMTCARGVASRYKDRR
jgi:hypothetical protein